MLSLFRAIRSVNLLTHRPVLLAEATGQSALIATGCGLLVLALLEPISAAFGGAWTRIAAWSWVCLGAASFTLAWLVIGRSLAGHLRRREGMPLLVLALAGWVCFSGISGYEPVPINFEATQQVVSGLANWKKENLGYHENAFLGYPARQYLLVAVPAQLFGRELLPLRLGYALLFFTGFAVFLRGLQAFWRNRATSPEEARAAAALAAFAGTSVLSFPVLMMWLRQFEQTILPIAFVLMTTGWLASYLATPRARYLLPLAWSAGMLGTCYLPGLAAWVFFLLIATLLAAELLRQRPLAWPSIMGLTGVTFYALSMGVIATLELRTTLPSKLAMSLNDSLPPLTIAELIDRVVQGLGALLMAPAYPYIHPLLAFLLLGHIAWLLSRRPTRINWWHGLVWVWAAAVLVAGLLFRGYVYRPPAFDIYRSMIIIPPVMFAVIDFWGSVLRPGMARWLGPLRLITLALLLATVVQFLHVVDVFSYAPVKASTSNDFLIKVGEFSRRLADDHKDIGKKPLVIAVSPSVYVGNLYDYTPYFASGSEMRKLTAEGFRQLPPEIAAIGLFPPGGFPADLLPGEELERLPVRPTDRLPDREMLIVRRLPRPVQGSIIRRNPIP